MLKIIVFSRKYFRYLFYFLLVANLLIINKLNEHAEMLNNKHATWGVVSLELSLSQPKQDSILDIWANTSKSFIKAGAECPSTPQKLTAIQVAHSQNGWDLLFIVFYTSILILLCIRLYPDQKPPFGLYMLIAGILIAGALDYTEDIFIYAALHNPLVDARLIWMPATLKFIILIVVVGYLAFQLCRQGLLIQSFQGISRYITGTLILIWNFRIGVFCLVILFLALWSMDQGRDLLLIINSNWLGPVSFLTTITILALLNWYLSKLYIPAAVPGILLRKYFLGTWVLPRDMNKNELDGARLIGALTFLVPMICILNAMRIFGIPFILNWVHPFILLISVVVIYQLAIYYNWINRLFAPEGKVQIRRFVMLSIVVALVILYPLRSSGNDKPYYLGFLALDLFVLSLLFLVFTTIRTCDWSTLNFKKYNITPFIFWPGMILVLIFIVANISPRYFYLDSNYRLFTLPVIISALCFYNLIVSFVFLKGKIFRIQFITILLIAGVMVSSLKDNPFHKLNTIRSSYAINQSQSLPDYVQSWLISRKSEIDSFYAATNDSFPVFIINAYGGGIRAAIWPTLVVSRLDSLLLARNFRPFQHYVFAYSGASGGTVGFSGLTAARYFLSQTPSPEKWSSMYRNDFLTPEIIGIFGRDAWSSSFGLNFYDDRSVLQEHEWEKRLSGLDSDIIYDSPFVKYWDHRGRNGAFEVPLLFSNTYHVDSGLKAIVAPVRLSHRNFPGTIFVEDLLAADSATDIRLSTAAILSARFPFISPTGKIDKLHHFSDGGFKENSGAETSREIMSVFYRKLREMAVQDTNYWHVKIVMISLVNSIRGTDSLEIVPNFNELSAPLTALMNNREGNTRTADTVNARDTSGYNHYHYFQLRPSTQCVSGFIPVLPLGWQISDYALDMMKQTLIQNQPDLQPVIKTIIRPLK